MRNVLTFLDSFDTGGVTSVVRSLYNNMNGDNYNIDFARRNVNLNEFDNEIVNNKNKIYYYEDCGLNRIPIWNYKFREIYIAKQIISQVKQTKIKYDVIHIHANPIIGLYIGVKLNIPVRIMHTHEAIPDFGDNIYKSKISALIWRNRQKRYNEWSTVKAGDSKKACCVKFGKEVLYDPKMIVLYPPVDINRFDVSRYSELELESFHINTEEFNIIHVGRLNPIKNQSFMIDILKQINEYRVANLYFVGDGDIKEMLADYARRLGVRNRVFFLSGDTTPGLYKLMDCSLLTSFSEAFGMVAVESQLMGVPCFASTNVPTDVDIGMCTFLDLEIGAEKWAEVIMEYDYKYCTLNQEQKKEFDTETLLSKLERIYNGVQINEKNVSIH